MSEQGNEPVNPGQAIYDALSDEAKAAVDALPENIWKGIHGSFILERFANSTILSSKMEPDTWVISSDKASGGLSRLALVVCGSRALCLKNGSELEVRFDATQLPQDVSSWLEDLNLLPEPMPSVPGIHSVDLKDSQLEYVPGAFWEVHEHALQLFNDTHWDYKGRVTWHNDSWRVKLSMLTGKALQPPAYIPEEYFGRQVPQARTIYDTLTIEAKAAVDALPDEVFEGEHGRRSAQGIAWGAAVANEVDSKMWSILCDSNTSGREFLALNVGNQNVITWSGKELRVMVDMEQDMSPALANFLQEHRTTRTYSASSFAQSTVDAALLTESEGSEVRNVVERTLRERAGQGWARNQNSNDHRDDWRVKLAMITGVDLPAPSYVPAARLGFPRWPDPETNGPNTLQPSGAKSAISGQLAAIGLKYTSEQIASFYTALQTKGFVILSGISGTGKSKIAQQFADMLPSPAPPINALESTEDGAIRFGMKPYMQKYNRFIIPKRYRAEIPLPSVGESWEVVVNVNGVEGEGTVSTRDDSSVVNWVFLKGDPAGAFRQIKSESFTVVFDVSDQDRLSTVRVTSLESVPQISGQHPTTALAAQASHLFLPVRPDWRDGKPLIGYHNPLSGEYVRTDFLDFVLAASDDYSSGNRNAFFVILDEMNLSHVEYYFADVLSVIESGRDADGWTVEGIPLDVGEEDADLPDVLKLPPNLYIVGTVNMDETTHPFSPKVLDRAFTIELTEVDFSDYPPDQLASSETTEAEKQALLRAFTQGGRYPRIDKVDIRAVVEEHSRFRDDLQSLNTSLRRSRMHFGYRILDEIMQFVANAKENGMFEDIDNAFDLAVLMKVLPKFNGSRAKLENALMELIHWCRTPESLGTTERSAYTSKFATLQEGGKSFDTVVIFGPDTVEDNWRYPATGKRAALMMQDLYTDGFASFG